MKTCTVCGAIARTARCSLHPKPRGSSSPIHSDPRWTQLSQRMIKRHVGQYGWVCPGDGDEHLSHPSTDLTTDHVLAIEQGGAPFDPANMRVLCRSWNSTLGARLVNAKRAGVLTPRMPTVADGRALIRARFLG